MTLPAWAASIEIKIADLLVPVLAGELSITLKVVFPFTASML